MTKDDVTLDGILDALMDKYCNHCSDVATNCAGCLVRVAFREAGWLDMQRQITKMERGDG